ncbi:MAG: THUMP domain-containing protein [Candidatus Methanomethylicia archaeon]|nr:THUMP domain-containing protein [Candidatus Methanomethylicia archaeon]
MLLTTDYGKERAAGTEALDLIYPYDPEARALETGFGGVLFIETALGATRASRILAGGPTSLIRTITPIDALVGATKSEILGGIARLIGDRRLTVKVRCRRRGRAVTSSTSIESEVGAFLTSKGHRIDLADPQVIVNIDIIGRSAAISVRKPEDFIRKPRGCLIDRSAKGEGEQRAPTERRIQESRVGRP